MGKSKFTVMYDRLPNAVKETAALSLKSKKVLAALLELLLHSDAKESGVIIVANAELRKLSGIRNADLLHAVYELEDYDLITREKGYTSEGGTREASHYVINFETIQKPIEERSFSDLFQKYVKSSEMPMGTRVLEDFTVNNRNEGETSIFDTPKSLETPMGTANINRNKNINKNRNTNLNINKNRNMNRKESTNTSLNEYKTYTVRLEEEEKEKNNNLYTVSVLNLKKEKELTDLDAASEAQGEASEIEVFENKSFGVPMLAGDTSERAEKNMTPTTTDTIEQRSVTQTVTTTTEVGELEKEDDTTTPTEEENTTPTEGKNSTPTEAESTPTDNNAFSSPLTGSNAPSGTITHQHGENATEAQEMTSNGITVHYTWGTMEFEDEEQHRFFDQVGVLLKRLEAEDDDLQFRVKLGKFRNWLIDKGMSKETFDQNFLQRITRIREDRKKEERILAQRRALWGRRRV